MKSRSLTKEEVTEFIRNAPTPWARCLIILGLKTGFRISELLSLRFTDVMGAEGVKKELTISRKFMKGKHQSRTVPLNAKTRNEIFTYRVHYQTLDLSSKMFPISRMTAHRAIKQAAYRAGIQGAISTHSMRKTFGQQVYNNTGKDVVAAQQALGHKNLSSTTHYLSIGKEEVDNAILAL